MNRKFTYIVLVLLVTTGLYFLEKYVDQTPVVDPVVDEAKVASAEFGNEFLPASTTGVKVNHAYYSLSYSERHEQAEWVAYEIRKDHLSKNEFERPYFIEDKKVASGSADWRNYKNSGYDRGHLCPAGARRFSYDAYHETFFTSNISPQDRKFNAGVWNRLEQKVRRWAQELDGVYVITGGVLEEGLKTIGKERVSVPKEFYKIVIDNSGTEPRAIAFLIPNKETSQSYFDFVVAIDDIESKTGIDFLKGLSDDLQNDLERKITLSPWTK